ncbi:MAG TPA: SRPBCC domain-containing protein [Solirubrobacteraceae bacterium]|jgi:uncharacterized protein YndB with AHSA1/START domain/predicted enzyme related to lactoylglutathione lyase|nr:SRPBCC domain-containing protein [Solirubrobacteraceae bacterium]
MMPEATSQETIAAQLEIVREYDAAIEDVWELWTTKAGIESWWGPDGFEVEVSELDLRPGGRLRYTMTATAPEQREFMAKASLPLSTELQLTYTDVRPYERLAYEAPMDFIPGVESYAVATSVELRLAGARVQMILRFDRMHDELWTERARAGHESELARFARVLQSRNGQPLLPNNQPTNSEVSPVSVETTDTQPQTAVPTMNLELVPVPVSDVDRAKAFYESAGFGDVRDIQVTDEMRVVQLTPPGSGCAIVFGTGMGPMTDMEPGSVKGIHLVVEDITAAHEALVKRGVEVGEVEDMGGVLYAWFSDPDGNLWTLQQWSRSN